jgi:hypothetical protein
MKTKTTNVSTQIPSGTINGFVAVHGAQIRVYALDWPVAVTSGAAEDALRDAIIAQSCDLPASVREALEDGEVI